MKRYIVLERERVVFCCEIAFILYNCAVNVMMCLLNKIKKPINHKQLNHKPITSHFRVLLSIISKFVVFIVFMNSMNDN